jgi:hypothetical protein
MYMSINTRGISLPHKTNLQRMSSFYTFTWSQIHADEYTMKHCLLVYALLDSFSQHIAYMIPVAWLRYPYVSTEGGNATLFFKML